MAYRRTTRRSTARRSSGSRSRARPASRRRVSTRRSTGRRSSGRGQTVRLVIEHVPGGAQNPANALAYASTPTVARKAQF